MVQPGVIWIHVPKPAFDLVGLVLSSLKLSGVLLLIAVVLGCLLGWGLILHRRKHPPGSLLQPVSLHEDA